MISWEIKNECSRWIDHSLAPLVGGARLGWISFYSTCHKKAPRFFKLDNDLVSVMSKYITGPDYQAKLLEMFQIANMEDRHLKSLSIGYQNCSIENIQTMYEIFKPSTIPYEELVLTSIKKELVLTSIKKELVLTAIKKVRSVEQFQWVVNEIKALGLVFKKGSILASSFGDAISHHWPIELLASDTLEIPTWCLTFSSYNKDIFRMIMARLDKSGLQHLSHTLYLEHIHKVFKSKRLKKTIWSIRIKLSRHEYGHCQTFCN